MSSEDTGGTWERWQERVLFQLEEQGKDIKEIEHEMISIREEIARLQMKAGVWGLIAGGIPALVAIAWMLVK